MPLLGRKRSGIALHTFGPFMGTPDSSPFVIKTMVLLKLASLEFREVRSLPFGAPYGFLPWIEDERDKIADSTLIRFHIEKKYRHDFDSALTDKQKPIAWAIERLCEDHLYFAMLRARWLDRKAFREGIGRFMFQSVAAPARPFAKRLLIRMNRARLAGHGLGRLAEPDANRLAARDVDALADVLGDKPYLFGDLPCGADATVLGFVTAIMTPPLDIAIRRMMTARPNLVSYRDRLTRQFFEQTAVHAARS